MSNNRAAHTKHAILCTPFKAFMCGNLFPNRPYFFRAMFSCKIPAWMQRITRWWAQVALCNCFMRAQNSSREKLKILSNDKSTEAFRFAILELVEIEMKLLLLEACISYEIRMFSFNSICMIKEMNSSQGNFRDRMKSDCISECMSLIDCVYNSTLGFAQMHMRDSGISLQARLIMQTRMTHSLLLFTFADGNSNSLLPGQWQYEESVLSSQEASFLAVQDAHCLWSVSNEAE